MLSDEYDECDDGDDDNEEFWPLVYVGFAEGNKKEGVFTAVQLSLDCHLPHCIHLAPPPGRLGSKQ